LIMNWPLILLICKNTFGSMS